MVVAWKHREAVDLFRRSSAQHQHRQGSSFEGLGIFGSVHLAKDGGLPKVGELFHPGRYFGLAVFCIVLAVNVLNVVRRDLQILLHVSKPQLPTLMLTIFDRCLQNPAEGVAWFEIAVLLHFAYQVVDLLFAVARPVVNREGVVDWHKSLRRWHCVNLLLRDTLPLLQTFSALRVLHYVVPPVLLRDLKLHISMLRREHKHGYRHGCARLIKFVMFLGQRLVCLLCGMVAFLVKLRQTLRSLEGQHGEWYATLQVLLLMHQLMGVVHVKRFVNRRIYLFMFGGVDSEMSSTEKHRVQVWQAAFMRQAWSEYGRHPMRFLAVAITFNDMDFQRLVFDDSM